MENILQFLEDFEDTNEGTPPASEEELSKLFKFNMSQDTLDNIKNIENVQTSSKP